MNSEAFFVNLLEYNMQRGKTFNQSSGFNPLPSFYFYFCFQQKSL